jgi:uracil-DNA glycosylase family 4
MTRCEQCSGKCNYVPANGPWDARCMFIGEAPGKDENKHLKPFVGKTGEEVNRHYLPCAGLKRDNVMFTNAVKCLPDSTGGKLDPNREKDIELLNSCSSTFLYNELQQVQPKLIIPMGNFACRAIDPDIDLELQHGIPLKSSWGDTFPMYHPALGIHSPKTMLLIRNDWIRLGKYLEGKLRLPKDEYPNPDYRVVDARGVQEDLEGCEDHPIACDTEILRTREPYCLTYSVRPGTGRFIRASDKEALLVFQDFISRWRDVILWHNWLFDIHVVTDMGLKFPHKRIVDTMVKVFHLGNLPQGLKALAYRELGMKMQDFDDLVKPHSAEHVLNYYRLAALHNWDRPDEQLVRGADGKMKLYKPQTFNTKLKRFFTDYAKNPSKDPFAMWTDNWEDLHEQVEERIGKWPGKCISHAPFDEVLFYACRDADSLIRLWPLVNKACKQMRKRPQEYWTGAIAA